MTRSPWMVVGLGGLAVATVAAVLVVARRVGGPPTAESDAAVPWTPPPDVAAWPEGAGVIVDVNDQSLTGSQVPNRGVYLVTPESGQYARWTGASAACSSSEDHCLEWAAARDRIFVTREGGPLLAIDPAGAATEIHLAAMGAPHIDPRMPIAASWDGRRIAYTYRSDDGPGGSVVVDLERREVLRPTLPHMSRSGWMALSPDGTLAYVTPAGLGFVGMASGAVADEARGEWRSRVSSLAWAPDGAHLLAIVESRSGEMGMDLWIIDARTREASQVRLPLPAPEPSATPYDHDLHQRAISASFAPDGRSLVVLSDVDARCGHPRVPTHCECDAMLYRSGLDGSGWRKMSDRLQACGAVFWVR